jgi:molecular chaperone Hsp33
MDRLLKAITEKSRIRIHLADVTMVAKALEARHLSGPVAAAVLGEALASVAILATDTTSADEAWMLRMHVSGGIGGVLVEATGAGHLRGFTNRKVLDALDGLLPVETAAALGEAGSVQIVCSAPSRILNQAVLQVNPPQLRYVLARFFNHSQQVPTGCDVAVVADQNGLLSARAIVVQRMVDSDQEVFVQMLEKLESHALAPFLKQRVWPKDLAPLLQKALGCDAILFREERSLAFACRCSKERILGVLSSLSIEELDALILDHCSQDVTCHMCGQTYTADPDDLRLVRNKVRDQAGAKRD